MKDINFIPALYSERLELRAFTVTDIPDLVDIMQDKSIYDSTLFIPYPYRKEDAFDWIASHSVMLEENKAVIFAVMLKGTRQLIGSVGLTTNTEFNNAELGYWISKEFRDHGFATEASARAIAYGFEELELKRIFAHYMVFNPASGKVMEKLGMKKEGVMRSHVMKNGKYTDIVYYGILREEYYKNQM